MPATLGEVEATRVAGLICKLISVWPWSWEATVGAPSSLREPFCCGPASPSRGTCRYGSGEGLAGRSPLERRATQRFVEEFQPAPHLPGLLHFADYP